MVVGCLFQGSGGEHVVPERELDRWEGCLRIVVQGPELGEEDVVAARVTDQNVEAYVHDAAALAKLGDAELEERRLVERQHLMRHLGTNGFHAGLCASGRLLRQVEDLDLVRGHGIEDPLATIGQDDRAEHLVAIDQRPKGGLESTHLQVPELDLPVDVTRNAPQLEGSVAADPIGLLDVGQRERLMSVMGARRDDRPVDRCGYTCRTSLFLPQSPQEHFALLGRQACDSL